MGNKSEDEDNQGDGEATSAEPAPRPMPVRRRTPRRGESDHSWLDEDLAYQQRMWVLERLAWVLGTCLILAALMGLFGGGGPMTQAVAGDPGAPIRLEYERFGQLQAPMTLRVRLGPGVASDGQVQFWFDRDYLNHMRIERITPEPESEQPGVGRVHFRFQLAEPGQPAVVTIALQPERIGPLTGRVGLVDGPALDFQHWIYP